MKKIYWVSTIAISLILLFSALSYLVSERTITGIHALGFPDFFRIELAVLKIIAAFVILAPFVATQIKEWAYAGAGLFFLTAIIAHAAHGDPILISLVNVFFLILLAVSNIYLHKTRTLN